MVQRRTRVKVCGLTSVDNALAVEACGVDAIGLVFYKPSPRYVSSAKAAEITAALGPLTHKVGLFVNASAEYVEQVLGDVNLSVLQFHGDESDEFCRHFRRPFFKALRMQEGLDVAEMMASYPSASGFLLDAYKKGVPGGTGESFDWARVPRYCARPLLLAGGLTPSNIGLALEQSGVYGVDVSGGVESAPGVKDIDQVRQLIEQVQRADLNNEN